MTDVDVEPPTQSNHLALHFFFSQRGASNEPTNDKFQSFLFTEEFFSINNAPQINLLSFGLFLKWLLDLAGLLLAYSFV